LLLSLLVACLILAPGPDIICEGEWDCPGGAACNALGVCDEAECVDYEHGDCPSGSHCEDGVCVDGCEHDDDCSSGACDDTSGACVECVLDSHCDGACDDGRCVECAYDFHCDGDDVCGDDNTCVVCRDDFSGCPGSAPFCIDNEECVECRDDDDCFVSGLCLAGTCL